jgi:hypothetical protein
VTNALRNGQVGQSGDGHGGEKSRANSRGRENQLASNANRCAGRESSMASRTSSIGRMSIFMESID